MQAEANNITMERLRSYSSVFSRKVFTDIIDYDDYSHVDWLYSTYDEASSFNTYMDYFKALYSVISKSYKCEYVYKNEIINQLLLKKYGTKKTVAFNELRIGNSIVDFAIINGESKAFEVKTEFDSPRRLKKQMDDYKRIFNKCYIVIPSGKAVFYEKMVEPETGIIELIYTRGRLALKEYRPATAQKKIDTDILMKCLRTVEYKNIVNSYFKALPQVPAYRMFDACAELVKNVPVDVLNGLFLGELKKRKNVTSDLAGIPKEIRQMCLCMNLSEKKRDLLINRLNEPLKHRSLCISRI